MISVQSRRLPSSGNKWILFLLTALVFGACSPKVVPVSTPAQPAEPKPAPVVVAPPKVIAPKVSTISLLLPFNLDQLNLKPNIPNADYSKADLAADYYQGFRFALDSLTGRGFHYNLVVLDTKEFPAQAHNLAANQQVRSSDLIVGPVFPENIAAFNSGFLGVNKPIVSPLSPAAPSQFKNNRLVTVIPPLEYHAWGTAQFIMSQLKPKRIFVLKSGFSDENKYLVPFRKAIDSLSRRRVLMVNLLVVHGNLDALIPQMSTSDENIFVIAATDEAFLTVTLHSLEKMSQNYAITLFGHPTWNTLDFLKPDLLQALKTHISTSDNFDHKAAATVNFIKNFKNKYHVTPTEYAIKGFDEGYYFGTMLGANPDALDKLDKNSYNGIYNQYNFVKTPGYGWVNTHINILQYQNFELKKVE